MSRSTSPDRRLFRIAAVLVAAIACGAFVISYSALYSLALAANIVHPLAVLYPFLVDGFIVVASLATVALRDQPKRNTWYPSTLLVVFFAFSVLGNAVHADAQHGIPRLAPIAAAAVSAVPPIALGLAFHLLLRMVSVPKPEPTCPPTSPPAREEDRDLRDSARRLLVEAQQQGRRMNGALLARQLGVSDRHGRRLLADAAVNGGQGAVH
jgi:hypothetical protein